jgi:F-type H+-transporting ATPase subunit b
MKPETGGNRRIRMMILLLLVGAAVTAGAEPLWAAEASGGWRATYDLVMRWVNFAILIGVIVYFGRRPVANLLAAQVERHASRIRLLEDQRAEALERLQEVQQIEGQSATRMEILQERIIALGEQQREELIADARRQGEMLIAGAHRRIATALRDARTQLRGEMVDHAVARALEKLPEKVTAGDNEIFLLNFLDAVERVR